MTDEEVQAMNRRMELGWEPSSQQWRQVAERCSQMPEYRAAKIWGLRRGFDMQDLSGKTVPGRIDIVPYPQFFHFKGIAARELTYEEAQALKTLMES